MTATVVVRRKTGTATDPATFEVAPVYSVIYDPGAAPHHGKARLKNWNGYERTAESAGATTTELRSETHFPIGAVDVMPGDVVTVVSADHPLLVGRSARVVVRVPLDSTPTADRVHVDENVGEEVPPWPPV